LHGTGPDCPFAREAEGSIAVQLQHVKSTLESLKDSVDDMQVKVEEHHDYIRQRKFAESLAVWIVRAMGLTAIIAVYNWIRAHWNW